MRSCKNCNSNKIFAIMGISGAIIIFSLLIFSVYTCTRGIVDSADPYPVVGVAGNYLKINSYTEPEMTSYYANGKLIIDKTFTVRVMINASVGNTVSILDHEVYSFYTNGVDELSANTILYVELGKAEKELNKIIKANE